MKSLCEASISTEGDPQLVEAICENGLVVGGLNI
jgi:hypothetical protein